MSSQYHFRFEDLKVYEKAIIFGESVHKVSQTFPNTERFELASQLRRTSVSIALNIAEGSCGSDKQFHHYLGLSWFSAQECVACSTKARLRNYISFEQDEGMRKQLTELSKMLTTLRTTISKRIA